MAGFPRNFVGLRARSGCAGPRRVASVTVGRAESWYSRAVSSIRPEPDSRLMAAEALAHVDALYAFAWRLAHDPNAAEDLVQETFARCLSAGQHFSPGSNLKAWLFRILRNIFIDQKRRDGRSPIYQVAELPESRMAAEGGSDPEQFRRLQTQDVDAALQSLPEEQRSVVLLDLEGFSEFEIAEVMGCAPGTVKSRLSRARAALRAQLQEYAT